MLKGDHVPCRSYATGEAENLFIIAASLVFPIWAGRLSVSQLSVSNMGQHSPPL